VSHRRLQFFVTATVTFVTDAVPSASGDSLAVEELQAAPVPIVVAGCDRTNPHLQEKPFQPDAAPAAVKLVWSEKGGIGDRL